MPEVWFRTTGKVRQAKFRPYDMRRLQSVLLGLEGKSVEIAVREERQKRNIPQNSKLHVLAREIANLSGESMDRIKRLAVLETLGIEAGTETETILGKEVTIVRRTSELSKEEASRVLDWMVDRAAFLEIPTPKWEEVEVMD